MLILDNVQDLGSGLWYLPQVFDQQTYKEVKRCYRETFTKWQCLYPNRLMSVPNNQDYGYLLDVALDVNMALGELVGLSLEPINQEIFVDLPGHQLSWHFDSDNYDILLQLYCGDVPQPNMGTHWYLGDRNPELLEKYGTNAIVPVIGLETYETKYGPNAGYVNKNTTGFKKAHGTRKVLPGLSRESVLFTFRAKRG